MLAKTATLQSIYIYIAFNSTFFPSVISSMVLTLNFSLDIKSESLNKKILFTLRQSKYGRKSASFEIKY